MRKTPAGPVCVSCKPYYCRGSWHYPQTYYEYDEVGLASWYGADCHGKPKANGELFDMMAMTAAHKTLPIPSVVKVTSMRNGRSVILVIDDRGPFVYKGRIIDLSYGAAKALDIHNIKPSSVRVQTLVTDSLKLSCYIKHYCKNKRDPFGRSWSQLYRQEIRGERLNFQTGGTVVLNKKQGTLNHTKRESHPKQPKKKLSLGDVVANSGFIEDVSTNQRQLPQQTSKKKPLIKRKKFEQHKKK
jgi:rare lipoprotein A (peptidoglycan hydrolase)